MNFCLDELIRPDLKGLEPYDAHYLPGVIRLDANENPHPFPPEAMEYIVSSIGPQFFGRYPDPMARELARELAVRFGVEEQNIMLGNGSDELILNIMLAFGVGKNVVIASPTFSMYGIHARVAGAQPVFVPRGPDFEVDVRAMTEAAAGEKGVVVLCNPNNPTGNATTLEDIKAVAGSVNSLVVVDEAYVEFGGQSCIHLLDSYPNLIIMRTFSKAYGLAGLRVGYLLASPEIVRELLRIKQPFNVNSFSQLAARTALRFGDLFAGRIERILADRKSLAERLCRVPGVTTYPSDANFIFFSTAMPAGDVYRLLLERGVMIRQIDVPGRGGYLRVSVGAERENDIFIDVMNLLSL